MTLKIWRKRRNSDSRETIFSRKNWEARERNPLASSLKLTLLTNRYSLLKPRVINLHKNIKKNFNLVYFLWNLCLGTEGSGVQYWAKARERGRGFDEQLQEFVLQMGFRAKVCALLYLSRNEGVVLYICYGIEVRLFSCGVWNSLVCSVLFCFVESDIELKSLQLWQI